MIPARYAPIAFGLILSGVMSFLVSGLATVKALGMVDGVVGMWLGNWGFCWAVAFPTAVIAAPFVRRLVGCMTCKETQA